MRIHKAWEVSSFVSEYHDWFVEMGYPQLDIAEYQDGSWAIIQMENSPVIPSLCRYRSILGPIEHVLITRGFVEKYVKRLDVTRREFWDLEDAKSKAIDEEHAAREEHAEYLAEKATQAVTSNPYLMERVAQNGLLEMMPNRLSKHISTPELRSIHKS